MKDGNDRIEGDTIILNGKGDFPKTLILKEGRKSKEYVLKKSQFGKLLLNK